MFLGFNTIRLSVRHAFCYSTEYPSSQWREFYPQTLLDNRSTNTENSVLFTELLRVVLNVGL